MIKKQISLSMAMLSVVLTACQIGSQPTPPAASSEQPAPVQDELLQNALVSLDTDQKPVQLSDGRRLSGHDLVQFIQDKNIPIVWDTENACNGDSCSVHYHRNGVWTHEDGQPGVEPIYISLYFQTLTENQMNRLVESIAHEIFHRMEPYGKVRDTQYEEFQAIYLSAKISGSTWENFKGYNPQNPICLKRWFNDHRLFGYLELPAYPEKVAATVEPTAGNDCLLEGDVVCTVTLEGAANCQPVHLDDNAFDVSSTGN